MEHEAVDAPAVEGAVRQYDVLRMLSWAFIAQIAGYTMLCIGSLVSIPQEGAWTIVTNGQQGLMSMMQVTLGALAGAATQRSQGK